MELIRHRRNAIAELQATPTDLGVEVDIRSQGDRLILHHDPFSQGEDFEAWLAHFRHGTLILNVKEEGLEDRLLGMMANAGIDRFFFLDQSFPFLIRTVRSGERRCGIRVSEFESIETALQLSGQAEWIWVDCFTRFPLSRSEADRLADAGFKTCLVSPELQGRSPETDIPEMQALLAREGISIDAVCTKVPEQWR